MRHVVRRTVFPDFELKSFDLLGVGRLFSLRKTADGVSPAFGAEELQVENIPSAAQAVCTIRAICGAARALMATFTA